MVTGEGDGDETNVLGARLSVTLNGRSGLRSLPGFRTDLGLPSKTPRIGEVELGHDSPDCSGNFGSVGITAAITKISSTLGHDWI